MKLTIAINVKYFLCQVNMPQELLSLREHLGFMVEFALLFFCFLCCVCYYLSSFCIFVSNVARDNCCSIGVFWLIWSRKTKIERLRIQHCSQQNSEYTNADLSPFYHTHHPLHEQWFQTVVYGLHLLKNLKNWQTHSGEGSSYIRKILQPAI